MADVNDVDEIVGIFDNLVYLDLATRSLLLCLTLISCSFYTVKLTV